MNNMTPRRYQSQDRSFFAEMNFTPFIDIIFVMMIIFMITAPFSQQAIEINLPQEEAKDVNIKEKETPIIEIAKDLRLFINGNRITQKDLEKKLKAFVKVNPKIEVYLKSDKEVPYGEVAKIMSRVKNAGIEKLGLVTEKPANNTK